MKALAAAKTREAEEIQRRAVEAAAKADAAREANAKGS